MDEDDKIAWKSLLQSFAILLLGGSYKEKIKRYLEATPTQQDMLDINMELNARQYFINRGDMGIGDDL